MLLLVYFFLLFLICLKSKSIAILLVLIQIISLFGALVIGLDYEIDSFFRLFNLLFTAVILTLFIMPWCKIKAINIVYGNEMKIRKLTNIILLLSLFSFIYLGIVSFFVWTMVDDFNEFKNGGLSVDFYYSLPINIKFFLLAKYLSPLSYFLIPLHFYYIKQKQYLLSFLCFFFSLNIIFDGLTYFSRSVFVLYILLYICVLSFFFVSFDKMAKKNIKKIFGLFLMIFGSYFIFITINRFQENVSYANTIPADSLITDPIFYSLLDYLSQWYYNSNYLLENYEFYTLNGIMSFNFIYEILGKYGLINYRAENLFLLKQHIWPKHWYTFNGLVAYFLYDFGYYMTIILSLFYYKIVVYNKPIDGKISLLSIFLLTYLIILPLMSIFYSNLGVVSYTLFMIYLIPISFYLKFNIKLK